MLSLTETEGRAMNLASRIHEHLHGSEDNHDQSSPFWIRHYDGLVRFASLGRIAKLHRGTLELAGYTAGQALLDIGCGTGDLVLAAEAQVKADGSFVGLDPEAGMIVQAKRKAAAAQSIATFAEAGIESIPYPDQSFDLITSSVMFHHLTEEQRQDGLIELHRLLKPGGKLIVVDINTARASLASRMPGHRDLDRGDPVREHVAEQLSQIGLVDISTGSHPMKAMSYAIGTKA